MSEFMYQLWSSANINLYQLCSASDMIPVDHATYILFSNYNPNTVFISFLAKESVFFMQ